MYRNWKITTGIVLILIAVLSYFGMKHHATVLTYIHSSELTRDLLDESLQLGKRFLLANQKEDGSFNYEYDFIEDKFSPGDSQVRQAGALWGLSLTHQEMPDAESMLAIEKGIQFFETHSKLDSNRRYIAYPTSASGRTGTVALVTLSLIDFLRVETDHPNKQHLDSLLDQYINFLVSLRSENGLFASAYSYKNGKGRGIPSPYFDGETLLALSKAAKYNGYGHLKGLISESAEKMYQHYVVEARKEVKDSNLTKGFYQWSSMSFYEIYTAGWGDHWAERTIELAFWMIDTHKTLFRTRNTAYAYEGLASAYQLAELSGDEWAARKIKTVIDIGLYKLISWQVGGPLQDDFLLNNPPASEIAIGGVINRGMLSNWGIIYTKEAPFVKFFDKNQPLLRIDVTQHQCHAMLLAKRFIYNE